MRLRKSFLTKPGELKYGVRSTSSSVAYRLRIYFALTALRSGVLASFCFFLDRAAFDGAGFSTFRSIASPGVWGVGLTIVSFVMLLSTMFKDGSISRFGLIGSGVFMMAIGSSFLMSAILYGSGWWSAVAYLAVGLIDFGVASYPGEQT